MPGWNPIGRLEGNSEELIIQERTEREAADAALIAEEVAEQAEDDAALIALQAAIDAEVAARDAAIEQEVIARAYADANIMEALNAESVARVAALGYVHTQSEPQTLWTVTHSLGYNPAGVVVESDGYILDGFGVQYLIEGESLRLSFDIAVSGTATIS